MQRYPCNCCERRFATDRGRKQHEYHCSAKARETRLSVGFINDKHLEELIKKTAKISRQLERAIEQDVIGQLEREGRETDKKQLLETVARCGAMSRSFLRMADFVATDRRESCQ